MVTEETKARFLGLYCMILADGVIDSRELETLYKIGTETYGLKPEEITEWVMDAGTSFVFPERFDDKIRFLYELAQIAWADGVLEDSEVQLIGNYAIRMGFEKENSKDITDYLLSSVKNNITFENVLNEILTATK